MNNDVEIRALPPRYYVGIRRVVKQQEIGAACGEILPRMSKWLESRGIAVESPPITVYHSVNRDTGDFDIQPGFFVGESVEPDGDITCGRTAGGDVLTATHIGSYDTLGDTWHAVRARATELNRPVTKSSWEVYIDDPGEVLPDKLRTQIFVPLDDA